MMKPPSVQPAFVRQTLLLSILALFLVWSIGYASSEVDELIEVLNSGDYNERCDSALRLAELGPEAARAVPFLANLLQSGDYWLGRECATALVQIGTDDALQALAEGLKSKDSRPYTLETLTDVGNPLLRELIPQLIEIVLSSGQNWTDDAIRAIEALERIDAQGEALALTLAEVLMDFESYHNSLCSYAFEKLFDQPDKFMPPLIESKGAEMTPFFTDILLRSDYHSEKEVAAKALALIGTDNATQVLAEALTRNSAYRATVWALTDVGTPALKQLTPQLVEIAIDPEEEPGIAIEALEVLSKIDSQGETFAQPLATIISNRKDYDYSIHEYALLKMRDESGQLIPQLIKINDTETISFLKDILLHSALFAEQEIAAKALIQIGTDNSIQVLAEALTEQNALIPTLGALMDTASPKLEQLIAPLSEMALDSDEDPIYATWALEVLEKIDSQKDVLTLTLAKIIGLYSDYSHDAMREYALERLFAIQPSNAVLLEPIVEDFLLYGYRESDAAPIELLRVCPLEPESTKGLVHKLTNMIEDPRYVYERRRAIEALGAIGPPAKSAIPTLEKIVAEDGFAVELRLLASKALGDIDRGAKAIPFLIGTMLDGRIDYKDRVTAAHILGEIGDPAVKSLTKATKKQGVLFDKNELNRRLACYALGIAGTNSKNPGKIVSALVKSLQDKSPDVRREAAMALRAIGPKARKAAKPLAKAFHDNSERVRNEASLALAAIGPDAVSVVVAKLKAENSSVRILAASTLSQIEPPPTKAVRPLKRLLNDDDLAVRVAAANAIEAITGTSPY